jgi:hypothetical protein
MTWLIAILGAVCLVWLWIKGSAPAKNRFSDGASLARGLRLLMSRGIHANGLRGTLTVFVEAAPEQRMVFTKHIENAAVGVRATLPSEAWALEHLSTFQSELEGRGIPYRVGDGAAAMIFDLGQDFDGAYMVARLWFEDTMGKRLTRDCVATFRDVMLSNSPRFTGVDDPDTGWGR